VLGQQARDVLEQAPVDLLLAAGREVLRRAEVLERAEARRGVEGPERRVRDLQRVLQVDAGRPEPGRRTA
jgi:hypothetical protein